MKNNESKVDRIIRIVVGAFLLILGIFGIVQGTWQVVTFVLSALLIITGVLGFCPAYRLFNFSTKKS